MKEFNEGDKVKWSSSGGESVGDVQKRITSQTEIQGHTAKATKDEPQYIVKSEKSGRIASHKPESLKKRG